jgi:hypothetical protein
MTEQPERPERPGEPDAAGDAAEARARARRLAEIFGDVLPESTGDDVDPEGATGRDDRWYTENRPPHHGG